MRKAERQRLSTKRDLQMVHRRKQYPALLKVPHFVMKSQPGQPGSNIMEQFWKWPRAWLEALVIGPVGRYRWCLELKSREIVQNRVYRVQDGSKPGVTRWGPLSWQSITYPPTNPEMDHRFGEQLKHFPRPLRSPTTVLHVLTEE